MDLERKIAQLLASLTIEEKVGQLFVLAFSGHDYEYAQHLIQEQHIGGFYITDDNAADVASATELAATLQHYAALRACDAPLILGVDQEGAWGILTQHTDVGPGNLALGKANDLSLTHDMYRVFAEQMQAIGYNTLLSPCADVNADPNNPIIGQRAFGETAQHVASHVAAAVKGVLSTDNLACAKHFPGHGDTHTDSHQALPVVDKSLEELMQQDLLPFKHAIAAGVSMIMTSHIHYPQIDPVFPATLSPAILTTLLKQQLGFNGLIITDSMNMWAMRKNFAPVQAAVQALKAGAHLIMLSEEHYENSTTPYKAIQVQTISGVVAAVRGGELSEVLIDEILSHVLAYKYTHLHAAAQPMSMSREQCKAIVKQSAKQAVTVLRNKVAAWPLQSQSFVLAFAADPKGYDSLVNARGIGPNDPRSARDVICQGLSQSANVSAVLSFTQLQDYLAGERLLDDAQIMVLITEDYPLPGEQFDLTQQQQRVQQALSLLGDRLIVIGMRSDYELAHYPQLATYVCAYSSRACSAEYIAELLRG